ncbi:putative ribonuclease H-like domain-containing protein [Tanacetum coccineum]
MAAAAAMKHMALNFAKLDKFEGVDFKRWQKTMHFLLSNISVMYVLTTLIPEDAGDDTMEKIRKRAKWDNDDYVCKCLILNGMSDSLFDIYQNVESSKELWDSLEAKYMAKDTSSKKFLVSNFKNYKLTDSRPVLEQYNKLLGILRRFTQHKMNMDEAIQEELTLVELDSHLCIEKSLRVQDSDKPKDNNVASPLVFKMVEHNNSSRYNDNKGTRKYHDNTRADPNKKAKPTCWKCGKTGHIKRDCKGVNVGNKANSSGTKGSVDGSSNSLKGQNMFNKSFQVYYDTYVSEAYFVQDDDVAWWADLGATVHVCKDRCWFKTYKSLNDGYILHIGNESTAIVHGRGCVDLRFSSGKIVSLFNALHVPNIRKNLVSSSERGIECIFVRYAEHSKAFRFYVIEPNDSVLINSIIESRDAIFDENRFSSVPRLSLRIPNGTEDIGGSVVPKEVTEEVVQQPKLELRRSKRNKTQKNFRPESQLYLIEGTRDEVSDQHSYCFNVEDDPKTFDEAMKAQDVAFWKKVNNDEMDSIMGNNTWVLADLPPGCKPLGCKWIFKRKLKVDGTIKKFKARLVIQGFNQKLGIDYFDTYALLALHKDSLFDELADDTLDYMESEDAQDVGRIRNVVSKEKETADNGVSTKDAVSTQDVVSIDKVKVSTDRSRNSTDKEKDSTDRKDKGTDAQIKGRSATPTTPTPTPTTFRDDETITQVLLNMSQAKSVLREKGKGVELKDVEETERPRPTSTRSLLTLKPLPKIDPKDKEKKKIKEEDESDTESEGIPEAEKKFKQLARDKEMARKVQEDWEAEEEVKKLAEAEATKAALSNEYDFIQARIEADRLLALRLQDEEREQFTVEERGKFLHDIIAAQRKLLAKQRAIAIWNKPPTRTQLRNQMMTYLKHVGKKKHSDLKNKTFEEIQALFEKVKRFDEIFIAVSSTEDERKIKEMNEGPKDPEQKSLKKKVVEEIPKEEDTAKVLAKVDVTEQSTKKRKSGHMKMIARKKKRPQPDVDSDDEHIKCLKIITFEGTINSEIMEKKSFISKLDKVSSPEGDYLVIHRANRNFRAFNYLMESDQQDWKIVTWRLYEACGVYILELEDGTIIHMLVERRVFNSPCFMVKSWLVQDQTVSGKDYSNMLIADSLLKTIWFINAPCYGNEALASPKANELTIPEQTATGKGKSNPFMADDIPPPPPPPPPSQTPTQQTPHTVSTIKLPILKKGEYDIWAMKMEHYLAHTDYPIWEVIQNGNGPVSITTDTQGQIKVLPPRTAEEILARERERKARTTLLMALPKDHLAKFHKMNDAKEMWEAIKSRFGGNDESKKMQKYILKQQFEGFSVSNSEGLHKGYDRFQSLLSQLEIHGAGVSTEDANQKFLRSLPSVWSQVSLIMRTKLGVDSLSFDNLYNNLRVFENDVKGSTASSSSTQNVAFVSKNTSSTNDVSTTCGVSNLSGQNSQYEHTSSYSLLANQSSCPQLDHEDLEQLDEFDLEEMDLKWQVAMISMRMKKFYNKTGHFARECRTKGNQDSRRRDAWNSRNKDGRRSGKQQEDSKALVTIDGEEIQAYTQGLKKVEAQLVAHQQGQLLYEQKIKFMKIDLDDKIDVLTYHKKLLAEAQKEKDDLKAKVKKWHNSSKNLGKLLNSQMSAIDKFGLGYGDHRYDGILSYENEVLQSVFMSKESDFENQPLYDRFVTAGGMHVVPPPMTGNYMPSGPDIEIDYSQFTYGPKQSQPSESETQTSEFDTCKSNISTETPELVSEPVINEPNAVCQHKVWSDAPIIMEYESDSEDEHVSLPTEEQETPSFANQQVKTPRETVKNQFTHSKNPKVDKKGLGYGFTTKACFVFGSLSHLIRDCDFHEKRMAKQAELNNRMRKKSTVLTRTGTIPVSTVRVSGTNNDYPHNALQNKGIVDSGCSKHMTGNKAYLAEYQDFNGGPVAFGGKLQHFNLFSVSQICDKKNKVIFTDSKCLVLSPEFKLPDANQVLLRIPRQNNMYSFNLENIVPSGGLACLIANATIDESNKWHRRLGHVNFKNLNKLVKGNLVRGLPLKIFQNDHTCVACQKGKQHKASCKAKSVSSISHSLQLLHMDLFGPTSIRSLNHKTYCLVITDDFSRFSWVFFLRTKDETSGILKDFIRQIENQLNQKVKTIRCDNGTKFKNRDFIEFCGSKGIKREYSNARTPQQNRVAERKNRTLIEVARTMLADSFLPNTFWAEAVSTSCYVLNRVLVTKPHNKTHYELVTGKIPIISYTRPFGCHVTILNNIDHLGKFDGKSDEGFLVGYSLQSKAFRVYNLESKRVEENLHITFLENKPNVAWKGPTWLFDLDYLTDSINYQPVRSENQANNHAGPQEANQNAGTEDIIDAGDSEKEVESAQDYFVLPIWSSYSSTVKRSTAKDAGEAPNKYPDLKTDEKPVEKEDQEFAQQTKDLLLQAGAAKASSTNIVNTASTPVSTASPYGGLSFTDLTNPDQDDSEIPALEDIYNNPTDGIFTNSSYDDEGAVADFTNLEPVVNVSPIPTSRINSIHPSTQILRDPQSAVQTRSKVTKSSGAHAFVYRNKKDKRGVVVRNKERLVAQGHRQEEGIDYDEVFAPMTRIEAIRIFLAFASYMGFIVYQMDVKSAFLYGKIDEEIYVSQPPCFIDPQYPKKVYKVVKALYGLHQAPRAWYATLSTFLLKNRYRRGTIDKTLFIKKDKHDIIFGSTKKSWCDEFEALMKSRFQISSMGELTFFLICACSRFQVTPKTSHLSAVKKIFRYLKGKPKMGLWYLRVSLFDLEAYSDSDYAGANLDRKSTTRGCQFLGKRLISWQYKKQTIVATSTTEAEYVVAANYCGQVLWIQNQMLDYGFNFMNTKIYIDNESTICIVKNPVYHSKTKHIAIRHHFIRDAYEKKIIQVLKIHTDDNVANLLTKSYLGFRESLRRALDGTEALLLPKLFILWLAEVSTDSAKLVPLGKDSTAIETLKKIPPRV